MDEGDTPQLSVVHTSATLYFQQTAASSFETGSGPWPCPSHLHTNSDYHSLVHVTMHGNPFTCGHALLDAKLSSLPPIYSNLYSPSTKQVCSCLEGFMSPQSPMGS